MRVEHLSTSGTQTTAVESGVPRQVEGEKTGLKFRRLVGELIG